MGRLSRLTTVVVTACLCGAVWSACSETRSHRRSYSDDSETAGSGGGGGSGSGGSSGSGMTATYYAATGVTITEIALYQGVKRPLMVGGKIAPSDIPVVAGRDAMLRVFVSTDASYTNQPITAQLSLSDAGEPLSVTQTLSGSSTDASLGSTLNIDIPGSMIAADFHYSVRLVQTDKSDGAILSYPASGTEVIGAQSSGPSLKVQLVPVSYGADGSNRVPDTSQAVQDMYRDGYMGTYPAASVEISVHAPIQWNQTVAPFGQGWDSLLNKILSLRQQEGAPDDTYYFGIFAPEDSFGQYCSQGCVLGLAPLSTGPGDNYSRAAIGVAYADGESVLTAVHETGHNHGREHAPCDVQDADPNYPHPKGQLGVWGYDLIEKKLYAPTTPDFMSYCSPPWVSDYTFLALFDRMKAVNNAVYHYPKEALDRTYDRVLIGPDGGATWIEPLTMHKPPMAEPTKVVLETPAGDRVVEGQLYRYDHLPGGVLFWPRASGDEQAISKAARIHVGASEIRVER